MPRTFIRQDTQIRRSDVYGDAVTPSEAAFETNPVHIEDDLNNIRSQLHNLMKVQAGNWWDDLAVPATFTSEGEVQRGVDDLNADLHNIERKRVLKCVWSLVSVATGAGDAVVILGSGELPGNTTAALGAVTTLGTVVAAHGGTFGQHSLAEVAGASAISPKNLCHIVDAATRDPILSAGRTVYALLHAESGISDGTTITDTTTTRVQLSFVRLNAAGTDLEIVPFADIENTNIDYCYVERVGLDDLNEQDFLGGASIDVPAGANIDRQNAYDNQGTTPVDLTTNATLDLEGAGLAWVIRDDLEANLFGVVEGSAGGTSQVNIHAAVDEFDVDAVVNDFAAGATLASGLASPIEVGVTSGLIRSTAGDLQVRGTGELILDDGNLIGEGTWAGPGVKLTDTAGEVTAYEAAFGGEVSLFNAIVQAYNNSARVAKTYANVTSTTVADTDVGGSGGGANLDAQLPDMSAGSFLDDYDVFLNGELLRGGADASANNDYYPGTSLALGQLKFEFPVKANDVITVIAYS
jgi:hypothetical protein